MPEITKAEMVKYLTVLEEEGGNKSAAARRLAVGRNQFRYRIEKARLLNLNTKSGKSKKSKAVKSVDLEAENRALRERVGHLEDALNVARKPRISIPNVKTSKNKMTVRVCMPDVHGNQMDRKAVGAFLSDLEQLKPDELIGLGDLMECGGWLAKKHTFGYVSQVNQSSYEEDVIASASLLDRIQKIVPKVELLEGNHEERIERFCIDATLAHGGDAEFLRQKIAPEYVLALKQRGIPYHRCQDSHDGLTERGVIRRGRCFYTHGFSTAKHAATVHVDRAAGCIIYAHTHRADYSPSRTIANGLVAAWCPGCLSQLQPYWKHNTPTTWTHGYIVQFIDSDGYFQTMQIPIDNGKSFLSSVVKYLRK